MKLYISNFARKSEKMKQIILLLTGMLMIAIPFNAQTLKGNVTDEKNAPVWNVI